MYCSAPDCVSTRCSRVIERVLISYTANPVLFLPLWRRYLRCDRVFFSKICASRYIYSYANVKLQRTHSWCLSEVFGWLHACCLSDGGSRQQMSWFGGNWWFGARWRDFSVRRVEVHSELSHAAAKRRAEFLFVKHSCRERESINKTWEMTWVNLNLRLTQTFNHLSWSCNDKLFILAINLPCL